MRLRPAYSIVEAVAVLFIMVTVLTILMANYSTARNQQKLKKTGTEALSAIREAQQYALGGAAFGTTPSNGYGVRITDSNATYVIYADKNNNQTYDDPATDYVIETRTFVDGLLPKLTGMCPTFLTFAATNTADFIFKPPLPTISILKNGTTSCTSGCIYFTNPNNQTIHKTSIVQQSGVIDGQEQAVVQNGVCP